MNENENLVFLALAWIYLGDLLTDLIIVSSDLSAFQTF